MCCKRCESNTTNKSTRGTLVCLIRSAQPHCNRTPTQNVYSTGSDVERRTTAVVRFQTNTFIVTSLGFSLRFCVKIIMPVWCVCVLEVRRTKHSAGLTRTDVFAKQFANNKKRDERYIRTAASCCRSGHWTLCVPSLKPIIPRRSAADNKRCC